MKHTIDKNTLRKRKKILDQLYSKYDKREYVSPDPLQFLYNYDDPLDREIAGLVASSLAYGRVQQICKSVNCILGRVGEPSDFLEKSTLSSMQETFRDFKHRFSTGEDISMLLYGAKQLVRRYGSLHECFKSGYLHNDETILPSLERFVDKFTDAMGDRVYYLMPSPADGSACKRLNLYLKWMIRSDNVDPGGWDSIPASKLVIPLDVHMHRICYNLGMTSRKTADLNTVHEVTRAFREFASDDPTRYDFALTRMGMWNARDLDKFYSAWDVTEIVTSVR